jgi:hypothetical protein
MGKGRRWAAAIAAVYLAAALEGRAEAGTDAPLKLVLHVADHAAVPADILRPAQKTAAQVYARIGVSVEWTDGWATLASDDGAAHLDVVFLAPHMPGYQESAPTEFAKASHVTRRAYIFFGRVLEYARATLSDPARVLALVLAHEVGHMLLPDQGHTNGGLMRAEWRGRLFDVPSLSRSQGATIRHRLTARR